MAKTDTLQDSFATKDLVQWTWAANASAPGGQLLLSPVSGTPSTISANAQTDLTSSALSIQAVSLVATGGAWLLFYTAALNGTSFIATIKTTSGNLTFRESVAGVNSDTSITYNAALHKYWRIRESAGTVFWDTSADGIGWVNRRSKAAGLTYTSGWVQVYADTVAGSYLWDDLNITPSFSYTPVRLPNNRVGPMALRNSFRQVLRQASVPPNDTSGDSVSTDVTVGLDASGFVDNPIPTPAPPLRIPNRNVGPMALRNSFHRATPSSRNDAPQFVTRDAVTGNLMLAGERYRFSGANCGSTNFQLSENTTSGANYGAVTVNGLCWPTHSWLDAIIDSAVHMNMSVIRTFGFQCIDHELSLSPSQTNVGTTPDFNEDAFEPLDYGMYLCAQNGIKVVAPLVDNYQFFMNGKFQWCSRNGVTPTSGTAANFFTNATVKAAFKAYITHVLNHVNQYTGIAYKDDPTILAWETGNELEAGSTWGATFEAWTIEIAQHIKDTIGAKQLVADGVGSIYQDSGTTLKTDTLTSPYVDLLTSHTYGNSTTKGPAYYMAQGEVAHSYGKAYFIGESTWNDEDVNGAANDWVLPEELSQVLGSPNCEGFLFWELHAPLANHSDNFPLHYPGDTPDMACRVKQLLDHSALIRTSGYVTPITIQTSKEVGVTSSSRGNTFVGAEWTPEVNDYVIIVGSATSVGTAGSLAAGWSYLLPGNIVSSSVHSVGVVGHFVTSAEALAGTLTYTATGFWSASKVGTSLGIVLRGVDPANPLDAIATLVDSTNAVSPHQLAAISGGSIDSTDGQVLSAIVKATGNQYTTPLTYGGVAFTNTNQAAMLMSGNLPTTAGVGVPQTAISLTTTGDKYISVTMALAPSGAGAKFGDADTAVNVNLTADGVVGTSSGASNAITVGLSASGSVGESTTASSSITVGLTAAGVVGVASTATTAITVGLTAAGAVGTVAAATSTDLTVGLTADGSVGIALVDELHGAPQMVIPNRYVGPMALRAAFRRAQQWIAGPDNFNGADTGTVVTVGLSAAGVVGTVSTASSSITVGLTAAGIVGVVGTASTPITVTLTADGVLGTVGTASSSITVGLSAAGAVGASSTASTSVTVGLTASGVVGIVGDASTPITVGLTSAGVVGTASTASSSITVGLTADGVVGLVGSADLPISVDLRADGFNPANVVPNTPPLSIPNRYVGPMALRNAFRRAQAWLSEGTTADQGIAPSGITEDGRFGNPSAVPLISPIGVTPEERYGSPLLTLFVTPVGVSTEGAVGTTLTGQGVAPVGIPDGSRVGIVSLGLNLSPFGISPGETCSTPAVGPVLSPIGIQSGEVYGGVALGQGITPAGITEQSRFGTLTLTLNLAPTGIASNEQSGAPAVALVVTPVSIRSNEFVGISQIGQGITPTGIASESYAGAASFGLIISLTGIDSAERAGVPGLMLFVTPTGIRTDDLSGAIQIGQGIAPAGIGEGLRFGSVTLGLTLTPSGIVSGEAYGTPVGTLFLTPAGIRQTDIVGNAQASPLIVVTGIASESLFGKPTVTPGGITVAPAGINPSEVFGINQVIPGAVTISPNGIHSTELSGTANVIILTDITILPNGIVSNASFGRSQVTFTLNPVGIYSGHQSGNVILSLVAETSSDRIRVMEPDEGPLSVGRDGVLIIGDDGRMHIVPARFVHIVPPETRG